MGADKLFVDDPHFIAVNPAQRAAQIESRNREAHDGPDDRRVLLIQAGASAGVEVEKPIVFI